MRNLKFNTVGAIRTLSKEGSKKEQEKSFFKALAFELNYFSPMKGVAETVMRISVPEKKKSFISDGTKPGLERGQTYFKNVWDHSQAQVVEEKIGINHYRRIKRGYKRNGLGGILHYLWQLSKKLQLPGKPTNEDRELYNNSVLYFTSLYKLVSHLKLPNR